MKGRKKKNDGGPGGGGAKTKEQIAADVEKEYKSMMLELEDSELLQWSEEIYVDLQKAEKKLEEARRESKKFDNAWQEARVAYRKDSSPELLSAWHSSVTKSNKYRDV